MVSRFRVDGRGARLVDVATVHLGDRVASNERGIHTNEPLAERWRKEK